MIILGADHAGFAMKELFRRYCEKEGIAYLDLGPYCVDPKDDYPDYAHAVARKVQRSKGKDQGVLICGSGVGMSIAANRYKGVRAALVWTPALAALSKEHNHANVLCLANRFITDKQGLSILKAWLRTPYAKEKRHLRRVKKLDR